MVSQMAETGGTTPIAKLAYAGRFAYWCCSAGFISCLKDRKRVGIILIAKLATRGVLLISMIPTLLSRPETDIQTAKNSLRGAFCLSV